MVFKCISSLTINLEKISLVDINMKEDSIHDLDSLLECRVSY